MVARKPGHQGERGISRKPSCREGRNCFGEPVVTTLVRFFVCVRGCGCLLSTRLSLRPLSFEGKDFCIARAQMSPREGGCALERDESSQLFEVYGANSTRKTEP